MVLEVTGNNLGMYENYILCSTRIVCDQISQLLHARENRVEATVEQISFFPIQKNWYPVLVIQALIFQ